MKTCASQGALSPENPSVTSSTDLFLPSADRETTQPIMHKNYFKRFALAVLLGLSAFTSSRGAFTTADFGTNSLFIEAEDADFNHGQWVTTTKIGMDGPYLGGSYTNLGSAADLDFDWHAEGPNNQTYRPNTSLSAGKEKGSGGSDRGYFQVTDWWTLGWNNAGDWYNYTRKFPTNATDYLVYGHLASGGNPINIELDQITAGQGQADASQVKKTLGFFNPGRATAGWDSLEIFPLVDTNGVRTTVKLGGTNTLRVTMMPGSAEDLDYFAFVPVTSPYLLSFSGNRTNFTAVLVDAPNGVGVVAASVTATLNGAAVTVSATKAGTQTTVTYNTPTPLPPSTTNTVAITFKDTTGKSSTVTGTFILPFITTDTLFIEAEDADFSHGQFVTNAKIGMDGPYPGGSYNGLGDTTDLDFDWHAEGPNNQAYRPTTGLSAGKENGSAGNDRGYFQVTDWWTLGWNNGGDWYNYTRNFPATNQYYEVFGHLASGGAAINIRLDQITAGAGQTDASQVKKTLGYFAPGRATAGWDSLEIFPLTTAGGGKTVVLLNGKTTLRATLVPGAAADMDYFAFRPISITAATNKITVQPQSITIVENSTTTLSVTATTSGLYGISYQWNKNGVPIPGANSSTYTLPLQQVSDSGTKYTVDVSTPATPTITSAVATVTVIVDTIPPVALQAGSLKTFTGGTEVSIIFDKPLTASSIVPANFTLSGGATVSAARVVTNSTGVSSRQQAAVLTVSGVTSGTTYTVTIKGVADYKGNVITTAETVSFTASKFSWVSIGTVDAFQPAALATTNGFNLVSGGNAFWNAEDDITMVYEQITGDFDKIAQVEYSDPASHWARSGISARESLNGGTTTTDASGANPASRYQMIISDPDIQFDGGAANNTYETNRRLNAGDNTTAQNGPNSNSGTPNYPNSWVRLKRVGQVISYFYGHDGIHWTPLGNTDFGDSTLNTSTPLANTLFVGPTYGPENGNVTNPGSSAPNPGTASLWVTRIRNYGDAQPTQKPHGSETYAIGLNFGANESGALLSSNEVAGVDAVAQANWNNLFGAAGPVTGIVADKGGTAAATSVSVDWTTPNTWESTGRGEENNKFTGADHTLMTGYLDTGGAGPNATVTISNIPSDLTSNGYDVYVYFLGGVSGRGGGYHILDGSGTTVLKDYVLAQDAPNPTNFVEALPVANTYSVGDYVHFTGLKAPKIIVEGATDNGLAFGGTPRCPINAIQLVPASTNAPPPTLSVSRTGTGITLTFTGKLQSAGTVTGPYADVPGATSPFAVIISKTSVNTFYRTVR